MKIKVLKSQLFLCLLVFVSVIMTACNQTTTSTNSNNSSESMMAGMDTVPQVDPVMIYTLPTPVQLVAAIQMEGMKYNAALLNPAQRTINYASNFSKALNFGIYCVDLGYATFYDQNQAAVNYLSTIKKLGDELGILVGYEDNAVKRFEKNLNNKDTLIHIILDGFNKTHNYLADNDRRDVAILCFGGCYVEGLYLTANIAQSSNSKLMAQKLGEQKLFLDNLITLLEEFSDNEDISKLLEKLDDLRTVYETVEIPKTAREDGTYHYNTGNVKITPEQIKTIAEKISAIRREIIS